MASSAISSVCSSSMDEGEESSEAEFAVYVVFNAILTSVMSFSNCSRVRVVVVVVVVVLLDVSLSAALFTAVAVMARMRREESFILEFFRMFV